MKNFFLFLPTAVDWTLKTLRKFLACCGSSFLEFFLEFYSYSSHFWWYLKSETTLPQGLLTLNNFAFMPDNDLRPHSWSKLPKRIFWHVAVLLFWFKTAFGCNFYICGWIFWFLKLRIQKFSAPLPPPHGIAKILTFLELNSCSPQFWPYKNFMN